MASSDGSILIKTQVDTSGVKKGKKQIETSVNGIGKSISTVSSALTKLGAAIGIAFGVKAIVDFSKTAIKASNELENSLIGLQSIVEGQGKSFTKAKSFIDDYVKDGLVPAANATTAYKNLAMRGYSQAQIEKVMTALKDSAAFGRQASLSLGEAVTSATEGLKNENSILVDNAGVTKNVSKMWQDYARQIGVSVNNLTQAQKIEAEVNGIMQETRFQMGDAAKVANTFSGQASALSYAFNRLKVAVGDFIKPIIQAVMPAITTLINWLTKLFECLAKITALLFGKKICSSTSSAAKNAKAAEAATAGTLDNTNEIGKATKKANKQAEKQLATFDEIQKISENISDSASSDAEGAAGGSAIGESSEIAVEVSDMDPEPVNIFNDALKNVLATLEQMKNLFMEGFWRGFGDIDTSKIITSLDGIKQSLSNIFNDVNVKQAAQKLIDSYIKTFGTFVGAMASIGISIATGLVGGIEKFLSSNEERIKNDLIEMFDIMNEITNIVGDWWAAIANIFTVFAGENAQKLVACVLDIFYTMTSNITTLCLKVGRDVLSLIAQPIIDNQELIKATLNSGLQFLSGWVENIQLLISGILAKVQEAYDLFLKPIIDRMVAFLSEVLKKILNAYNQKVLPLLNKLSEQVKKVIEEHILPALDNFMEALKPIFEFINWAWDNILKPFLSWCLDVLINSFVHFFQTLTGLVSTFFTFVGEFIHGVSQAFKGLVEFLAGVFTGNWKMAWNGIKDIFAGVFNTILSVGKGVLNTIIDLINVFIRGVNAGLNLMSRIPGMGWLSFRIPEIPKLAQGAVIPPNKEFLAILGDQKQGVNIETPLQTMLDAFNAALAQNSNNTDSNNITVILELDNREFGRAVYKANNQESQRVGIKLGGAYA